MITPSQLISYKFPTKRGHNHNKRTYKNYYVNTETIELRDGNTSLSTKAGGNCTFNGNVEPQRETASLFLNICNNILEDDNLWRLLAPLLGEIDICPPLLTFFYGIPAQQLLFDNAYFWQRWALKWFYFPVFVHYNISVMIIFGAP